MEKRPAEGREDERMMTYRMLYGLAREGISHREMIALLMKCAMTEWGAICATATQNPNEFETLFCTFPKVITEVAKEVAEMEGGDFLKFAKVVACERQRVEN